MRKILILLFIAFISCGNEVLEFQHIDLSKISTVTLENPEETLFEFYDKYPGNLFVKDSLAFIIQVNADTFLTVLNIKTKRIVSQLGTKGNGPEDFVFPNFAGNINSSDILLYDAGKLLKINILNSGEFGIEKYTGYPDKVSAMSGQFNFSNDFMVGTAVTKHDKCFYIYNRKMDSIIEIDNFPKANVAMESLLVNSLYSPCLGLNEDKNRVVVGMYFFDMIHLFDLKGNKIKTCCFTENYVPQFNYDFFEDYPAGFKNIFCTKNYCYLMRYEKNNDGTHSKILLKINWDGAVETVYKIQNDGIAPRYYIDENQNKMYTIQHRIEKDNINEIFAIVAYNLGS